MGSVYASIPKKVWFCVLRLTENWTNNRDKWISLNIRFYWANRTRKKYGCRIAVVESPWCNLCWVLKVGVVESYRLRCLLICGDSTSRRWGWSLCLMQIVGVAVWSGCRCCWKGSMTWMHQLLMLNDRCPGLLYPGLTGSVDVAPKCWYQFESVVARGLGAADTCCLVTQERLVG